MLKNTSSSSSWSSMLRENAALISMYLLGVLLMASLGWPAALLYIIYCLASNVLHMAWTCPYCPLYAAAACHAGYHLLSGQRFRPQPGKTFERQFQRSIIALSPGWFVPPVVGGYVLFTDFSWFVVALIVLFCLSGFVILPVDSSRNCMGCDNQDCPRRKAS